MSAALTLSALAGKLRDHPGLASKADIEPVTRQLGLSGQSAVPVGDDCAAIADGDGFLLLAIEGFINEFVAQDPWFAGWCGVMVYRSDIAAMGGRAMAVVDAVWAHGEANAQAILEGMRAASERYGVPVVGGHSNIRTDRSQLSVAILGRAKKLLTSFDARPGDRLLAALDLRGQYRQPFSNWQAAIDEPVARLRGDLELLPQIAEANLCCAAKDISQGGITGTAAMLAECSGVGITIDVTAVPQPQGVALERWLTSFPSFGFLLSVPPVHVAAVSQLFFARGIAVADIGAVHGGHLVAIADGRQSEIIWDFAKKPLLGCGPLEVAI